MDNIIYTKNNCPQCKTVLSTLEQKGIGGYKTENLDSLSATEKETVMTRIAFEFGVIPRSAPIIVWDSRLLTADQFLGEIK